jgi:hypothetical protein
LKTSPNGAPILSGSGLQQVKDRIQQRFAEARESGATSLVPKKVIKAAKAGRDAQVVQRTKREQKEHRTLEERSAPLLKSLVESRYAATRLTHSRGPIPIVVPTESVGELFAQAVKAVDGTNIPQQKKEERHEIKEAF